MRSRASSKRSLNGPRLFLDRALLDAFTGFECYDWQAVCVWEDLLDRGVDDEAAAEDDDD